MTFSGIQAYSINPHETGQMTALGINMAPDQYYYKNLWCLSLGCWQQIFGCCGLPGVASVGRTFLAGAFFWVLDHIVIWFVIGLIACWTPCMAGCGALCVFTFYRGRHWFLVVLHLLFCGIKLDLLPFGPHWHEWALGAHNPLPRIWLSMVMC